MDTEKTDKIKLLLRILVPVLIVIALAVIWVVKTHPTPTPIDEPAPSPVDKPIHSSIDKPTPTPIEEQTENTEDFMLEATSIDLEALKEYELPIIIDFGADKCIPCKEMAPVLKTLNEEMQGKAIIKFVDVWKHREAAKDFPIQLIPTQLLFNPDGSPYVPSDDIDIEFDMYSHNDTGEHALTLHQGGLTEDQMRAILADMGVGE